MKFSIILLFLLMLVPSVKSEDIAPSGQVVSIKVLNPSFEMDSIANAPKNNWTPPTDWTSDVPFTRSDYAGAVGISGTNGINAVVPEGTQYLFVRMGHSDSQRIPTSSYTPSVDDILTLTVALGPGSGNRVGAIALTLDDTIVAQNSASTTGTPHDQNFADATVNYRITTADLHKNLGIKLIDPDINNAEIFDNVRLTVIKAGDKGGNAVLPPQVITALASNAVAPPPPKGPRLGFRVFSVGHSYHFLGYDLPFLLQEVSRSGGFPDHEIVGEDCIFGSKVIEHWNMTDEQDTMLQHKSKAALQAGAVDVFTMVGLFLPDEGYENYTKLAYKHNPNIRATAQEIWLPWDANEPHYWDPPLVPRPTTIDHNAATLEGLEKIHQPYFQQMDDLVSGINQRLGKQVLFVVPVGQAVIALRGKIIAGEVPGVKTQEELFADPLGHPKEVLQALTAYCQYAVIYKKNPTGLPIPSVLKQSKIPEENLDAINHLLQQLAWDAVIHHPLSGVTASPRLEAGL